MKKSSNRKRIKWETAEKPISTTEIEQISRVLNCTFPRRFLEIASKYNGGSPSPDLFDVGDREEFVFDHLLRFPDHFTRMNEVLCDLLPKGVVAFAVDPLDNAICFDFRESCVEAEPQIIFWDHEAPPKSDESLCLLAESFDAFLEKKLYR
jgi:hypothetical protein